MKKILFIASLLMGVNAFAQSNNAVNNQNRVTVCGSQGTGCQLSTNNKGDLYLGTGVAATDLGKSEDAPSTDGATGIVALDVREDTPTVSTSINGDYTFGKTNDVGARYVEPANKSIVPTAEVALGFATLTNTLTTYLTNSNKLISCTFNNQTNAPVTIDNSSAPIISGLPGPSFVVYDFGSNGRFVNTNLRVKYTAAAPTSGTLYINCY